MIYYHKLFLLIVGIDGRGVFKVIVSCNPLPISYESFKKIHGMLFPMPSKILSTPSSGVILFVIKERS